MISVYSSRIHRYTLVGCIILIVCITAIMRQSRPPEDFPTGYTAEIVEGSTVDQIAQLFTEDHVIRSPLLLRSLIILKGKEGRVIHGFYYFDTPQSVFSVANRITQGLYDLESIKITIPEGINRKTAADILALQLPRFSKEEFMSVTEQKEGYLFPDTYIFLPHTTARNVADIMQQNYEKKVGPLRKRFESFGKTEDEIITMASIIEGEARQLNTRRMIAGILWKRIAINMPLQVDATFKYINGKGTKELTKEDLALESLYNTYKYKGLPPTPISSPGLSSIEATITPLESSYLYFLTDDDGIMHYARTFAEHVANKNKYLP